MSEPVVVMIYEGAYWPVVPADNAIKLQVDARPYAPNELRPFDFPSEIYKEFRSDTDFSQETIKLNKEQTRAVIEDAKRVGIESKMPIVLLSAPQITELRRDFQWLNRDTFIEGVRVSAKVQPMFLETKL